MSDTKKLHLTPTQVVAMRQALRAYVDKLEHYPIQTDANRTLLSAALDVLDLEERTMYTEAVHEKTWQAIEEAYEAEHGVNVSARATTRLVPKTNMEENK